MNTIKSSFELEIEDALQQEGINQKDIINYLER